MNAVDFFKSVEACEDHKIDYATIKGLTKRETMPTGTPLDAAAPLWLLIEDRLLIPFSSTDAKKRLTNASNMYLFSQIMEEAPRVPLESPVVMLKGSVTLDYIDVLKMLQHAVIGKFVRTPGPARSILYMHRWGKIVSYPVDLLGVVWETPMCVTHPSEDTSGVCVTVRFDWKDVNGKDA